MLKNYLLIFLISMVPIIELRGAIPIGLGMGLPVLPTYLLCVLGNMIPVPFIYLFARKFLIWGYHKPLIGPICRFCINKGEKGGRALEAKAGKDAVVLLLCRSGKRSALAAEVATKAGFRQVFNVLEGFEGDLDARQQRGHGNGWRFQLFVRSKKGAPYQACGPVTLERAEGSKPMTIYWRLERPLPVRLYQEFSVLRDA